MNLIIPGTPDDVYALPSTLALKDNEFTSTFDSQALVFADGSKDQGGEIRAREIEIAGKVYAVDRATHFAGMRALAARAVIPNQRFQFETGYWMPLGICKRFKAPWVEGRGEEFSAVSIVYAVPDPYWYSDTETVATFSPSGNTTLSVDMTTDLAWASPKITVTAPGAGSLASGFTLANTTDQSLILGYTDAGLINGAAVVIDCFNGTVTRGGTKTLQYMQAGSEFLRLLPGKTNSIAYVGGACTIEIRWRKRWQIS